MNSHRVRCVAFVAVSITLGGCSAVEKLASAASGGSCDGPATISTTGSASGSTSGAGCKAPDGSKGNLYTLSPAQPTNVEVKVTPTGFQPWLGAFTASGALIAQTNASPWRLRLFLAPGSYQFAVSGVDKDGPYTLSMSPAEIASCKLGPGANVSGEDVGITMKGAVITGALTAADCGGGTYRSEGYVLTGAATGSTWTFSFTADRAADISVFVGTQTIASKSLTAAGTTTLTVAGSTDPSFRIFVGGTPGTGVINYSVTVN